MLNPLVVLVLATLVQSESDTTTDQLDSIMMSDPAVTVVESEWDFDSRLIELWGKAIARPEAELQLRAALSIARAHRLGMTGWDDSGEELLNQFDVAKDKPDLQLALAEALIELDFRTAAPSLLQSAKIGRLSFSQRVEPALARWDFQPAKEMWRERIDSKDASTALRVLAITCLVECKSMAAVEDLGKLATSKNEKAKLRIEAGRALGQLADAGLESLAAELIKPSDKASMVNSLVAAHLLAAHQSEKTIELLTQLSAHQESVVAKPALDRLLTLRPAAIRPLFSQLSKSKDEHVRLVNVQSLKEAMSQVTQTRLFDSLDDRDPKVRLAARELLLHQSTTNQDIKRRVIESALEFIKTDSPTPWRRLEQAIVLLGELDEKSSAFGVLEYLESEEAAVAIAATWTLRQLAVPDTFAELFEYAKRMTKSRQPPYHLDAQISQIFQMFGQQKYDPAEELMRTYVPKLAGVGTFSRCGAIWALGHLHADSNDVKLAEELLTTFKDDYPDEPEDTPAEDEEVQEMCIVSLGRIKSLETIDFLQALRTPISEGRRMGPLVEWAVQQITGEPGKTLRPKKINVLGWFIEPVEFSQ